jgi:sodium transport system permease protein
MPWCWASGGGGQRWHADRGAVCLSFLPGQWLLRSESLAALFQFGPREALPVHRAAAAAGRRAGGAADGHCHPLQDGFKEAQANATVVVLAVSLLPLVTLFNQDGERCLAPVGAGAGAGSR